MGCTTPHSVPYYIHTKQFIMTIKQFFIDNQSEIITDLNNELFDERIFKFWRRVGSHLTLREVMNTYWIDTKAEFCVDLGVMFGKMFELYLPFKLQEAGYDVEPCFSSQGDMKNGDTYWEIKTGRGKFIQGATHSPKEKSSMNLIQVLWDCEWDKSLDEIEQDGKFISVINICVFRDVTPHSIGKHSDNNSRTTLRFTCEDYDTCNDACVIGSIKKNRVNVGFTKVSCYN